MIKIGSSVDVRDSFLIESLPIKVDFKKKKNSIFFLKWKITEFFFLKNSKVAHIKNKLMK